MGLRAESREVCSCGILSDFSLSKEGRGKGFLESGVHAGLFAGCGSPWRGFVWPVAYQWMEWSTYFLKKCRWEVLVMRRGHKELPHLPEEGVRF